MDRINKNNYEAYFLDYHEGSLNAEEKQMTEAFLQKYPECYDEFEDYADLVLPIPEIHFPDKSELFKTEISLPETNDWEFLCIAFMEGDLTDDELIEFENQRKEDSEKEKVLAMYLSTKSIPEKNIQYGDKTTLKRKIVLIPRWIYGAVSSAAILVLAWFIFNPNSGNVDTQQFTEDSTRQVISVDRISHPGKYEKLASLESGPKAIKKSSLTTYTKGGVSTEILLPDDEMIRFNYTIASLPAKITGRVSSKIDIYAPASQQFAYRFIPGAEDDDYLTLVAFTGEYIRKQLLDQDPELVEKSRFSLWELADAGLEKVSNIFGTGADIEREYNESGDLVAVSFESALVGFNTPIKRRSTTHTD